MQACTHSGEGIDGVMRELLEEVLRAQNRKSIKKPSKKMVEYLRHTSRI